MHSREFEPFTKSPKILKALFGFRDWSGKASPCGGIDLGVWQMHELSTCGQKGGLVRFFRDRFTQPHIARSYLLTISLVLPLTSSVRKNDYLEGR